MYTIFIAAAAAVAISLAWGLLALPGGWILGPILGLVVGIAILVILGRRFAKIVTPHLTQASKEAEAGQVGKAIKTLEESLVYSKWYPLLEGQVRAQIGMLYFGTDDEDKALEPLALATPRLGDAKMAEASIRFRRGDVTGAKQVLQLAAKVNKRMVLLHNFLAFLHVKDDDQAGAIRVLEECLKAEKDNDATRENLSRVKQGNRLDMKQFGMPWYALKIERPPASMGMMQQARKGFRQKPKQPKKRRR